MTCGAAFIFDAAAESAIRQLWQAVEAAGFSSGRSAQHIPPHMTLFAAETLDQAAVREALKRLAAVTPPLPVTFHSLGVFLGASCFFLAPTPNRALLDLHAACWQAVTPFTRGIPPIYPPGVWTPHVTLGCGIPEKKQATLLDLLCHMQLPRAAQITGVIFGSFEVGVAFPLERVMLLQDSAPLTVRQVQPGDAEAYNRLVDRLDHETQFMLAEPGERKLSVLDQRRRIHTVLSTDNQMIFVAENAAGELVGLLGAHGGLFRRNHDNVHIYIGILQAYSGQGLGTRMFAVMETWARGSGAHRLELNVMVHNQRGLGLYQKIGFQIEGYLRQAVKLDDRYVDEYIMSKLLE